MTLSRVASDLAAILVPIGVVAAGLAALCAIIAAVAIVRRADGLAGGAVGVWIPFAVLSVAASFGNMWLPLLASGAALVVALVGGALLRWVLTATASARAVRVEGAVAAPPVTPPTLARSNPATAT